MIVFRISKLKKEKASRAKLQYASRINICNDKEAPINVFLTQK